MSRSASVAEQIFGHQYLKNITDCIPNNSALSIMMLRADLVQRNGGALSDRLNRYGRFKAGLKSALILAIEHNHLACMLLLFEPQRAQAVLNESKNNSGAKTLKNLVDLYNLNGNLEECLKKINAPTHSVVPRAALENQLHTCVHDVQQLLEQYEQKKALEHAVQLTTPPNNTSRTLKKI